MNKKNLLASSVLALIFLIIYTFRLKEAFFYHPDLARDLHEILKITQGDFVLLGPKLTFGGLYVGPYYFYIFVPFFLITAANIYSVHFFNALLFAIAIGYFTYEVLKRYFLWSGLLAATVLGFSQILLYGAKNPSNAYTFIPLFSILLTFVYFHSPQKKLELAFLGFLAGVIVNFHFLNVILMPVIFFLLLAHLKKKINILYFLLGGAVSFAPLVLFELKNNFIIVTNTFIQKSYLTWTSNKNIPGGLEGKKNVLKNIFFMADQAKLFGFLNPIATYILLPLILRFRSVKKKDWILYGGTLLTLVLFSVIIRFQFIPHYLAGTIFLFTLTLILISLKYRLIVLLLLFLIIELFNFPKAIYQDSWRKPDRFEKAVNLAISKKLINKNNSFNVIQITKENLLATIGFEYRFFLRRSGYIARTEFEYPQSSKLLIFSEVPYNNISAFNSWEAEQFGKQYFMKAKSYRVGETTVYVISK